MGYEITRYRPEFRDGVLKLLEHLWSPNASLNAARLEWKHERNPYQRGPLLYLALDKGRVVGMRGVCSAKWEAGVPRREFIIPCACDLVIAPDHRNRGVISKIMRFAFDDLKNRGMEYVFSLSAGPVTFFNSLAMGWRSIGPLQLVGRYSVRKTPRERLRRLLSRWPPVLSLARSVKNQPFVRRHFHAMSASPAGVANPFSRLDGNFRRRNGLASPGTFLESSPRPAAMADLVHRIGNDGRLRHVRDRQYLSWRFEDPLHLFRFLYRGESALEGYMVLEARKVLSPGDKSEVIISDWEATSPQIFLDLMTAAIRLGEFEEMHAWRKALPPAARESLDEAGFRPLHDAEGKSRYRPTVLVRSTGDEKSPAEWLLAGGRLDDANCWDVRPIYSQ